MRTWARFMVRRQCWSYWHAKDWPTHVYDGSLVLGNMMLAAHALGLGKLLDPQSKRGI